jgi:hypothetical protein
MKNPLSIINKHDSLGYKFLLRIGIVVFPCFTALDALIYPGQLPAMAIIRAGVTIFLIVAYLLITRLPKKFHEAIALVCFYVAMSSMSLMCILSGEGFDSPYYVGILQLLIMSALLVNIPPRYYGPLVSLTVVQHFAFLWIFAPFSFRGLWINVFGIGVFSIVLVATHGFIYNLAQENESLMGIVPICAKCKKIRDDKGYWEDVAAYISKRTEAEFSHGLCPECAKECFAELDELFPEA